MKRLAFAFAIAIAGAAFLSSSAILSSPQTQSATPAGAPAAQQQLVTQYCVTCHNQRAKTAGLALDTLNLADVGKDAHIWEEAVRKLRGGMMPPPGSRQPEKAAVKSLVSYLETSLDRASAEHPSPGRVALHRMNRVEYGNAIQDLFGFEVDASTLLPTDDLSDGFDNIASVLKVSPSFLDQYISAARFVSARALGNPTARAVSQVYRATDNLQNAHLEGLPLGTRGGMLVEHTFPADGEYVFDIGNLGVQGYVQGMEYQHRVILVIDGVKVFEDKIGGPEDVRAIDQTIPQSVAIAAINARFKKIRVSLRAGIHKIGVTFVERSRSESDEPLYPFVPGGGMDRIPRIREFQVTGPFNAAGIGETPSRKRILTCTPPANATSAQELTCATEILRNIARRAYRRAVTDEDLAAPLSFFKEGRAAGTFDKGIESAMTLILSSPKFLYRAIDAPGNAAPGTVFAITDVELASRLSFFLWSQGPDEELLNLAGRGGLKQPGAVEKQMRRMLADPKAHALARNFGFEWLNLRAIRGTQPDPIVFPNFDESLKGAYEKELELFIGSIFEEDRSILDLLTAEHTYVNERLALLYGIPDVRGDQFRRIRLSDPNRWGLLGKGGVLAVTSYPNRTSPVLRGAWILERITGTPPAAPPPDVEAFKENVEGEKAQTVRERMEEHRANPSCRSCHAVMDPLGFALENFDAIGQWRATDRYAGTPIDAAGQLVDGTAVSGPAELRKALASNPDQFAQALTEKLLMYALGRTVDYKDMPLVRKITRDSASSGYKFSSIVKGIVESAPFQKAQIRQGE
jgi:mono/diheme cytochrome c family protein